MEWRHLRCYVCPLERRGARMSRGAPRPSRGGEGEDGWVDTLTQGRRGKGAVEAVAEQQCSASPPLSSPTPSSPPSRSGAISTGVRRGRRGGEMGEVGARRPGGGGQVVVEREPCSAQAGGSTVR